MNPYQPQAHFQTQESSQPLFPVASSRIAVIGLGYVGLPLAVALAKHFPVIGFDINAQRIQELKEGEDRTKEVSTELLRASFLQVTQEINDLAGCNLFIVTVPTPIQEGGLPDLRLLALACENIAPLLKNQDVVVFESTVYPGVTEDFCGKMLENLTGMVSGKDFYLGYSPERINPGDSVHTVDKMVKVVAGQTPQVTELLKHVYGCLNQGQIFCTKSIAVAEAAKVIENAQRDINIAFINQVTMIMNKLNLSVYDVLEAARTKWNFLPFEPGLVGGHCIGIDPYYLAHCAEQVQAPSDLILAGRSTNEGMSEFLVQQIESVLGSSPQRLLVLGLTFKENVPDLRNSKVADLVHHLFKKAEVHVHDPLGLSGEAEKFYGFPLTPWEDLRGPYDGIVVAVNHEWYSHLPMKKFQSLLREGGWFFDIKGMWRHYNWQNLQGHINYWTL